MITNPDFSLLFSVITGTENTVPDHTFSKISKYRTENIHFPSTAKYYAPFKDSVVVFFQLI